MHFAVRYIDHNFVKKKTSNMMLVVCVCVWDLLVRIISPFKHCHLSL